MGFKNTFEIITKDIQELEKIVANFQNYSRIPKIEIDLALRKMQNLYDLMLMIREHEDEYVEKKAPTSNSEIKTTQDKSPTNDIFEKKEEVIDDNIEFLSSENFVENPQETPQKQEFTEPTAKRSEIIPPRQDAPSASVQKEKVLGEKFQQSKEYLNEKIGGGKTAKDLTSKIQSTPIKSIAGSMGINDKFFFIRELFHGNADNFNQAMGALDQMPNFNQAYNYLLNNFGWDMDSESVQQLLTLVRRKFISPGNE